MHGYKFLSAIELAGIIECYLNQLNMHVYDLETTVIYEFTCIFFYSIFIDPHENHAKGRIFSSGKICKSVHSNWSPICVFDSHFPLI